MMNLKEITRNLNGYHEHIQLTKNYKNIDRLDKFICSPNRKDNNPDKKNKGRINRSSDKISKNSKKMRLSDDINIIKKLDINKDEEDSDKYINNFDKDKNYILYDEEIDEEIKNLDIDEQNILELINKINNYGKE